MSSIHLFRSKWKHKSISGTDFYCKGWAEYKHIIYDAAELVKLVFEKNTPVDTGRFKEFLLHLNGNFSIIIHSKQSTVLCVDKMRCFPVIYFLHNREVYVTDDIDAFRQHHPAIRLRVDVQIVEQYLCSNFITGPDTLFESVFAVQAGEMVEIVHGNCIRHSYFQWTPKMDNDSQRDLSVNAAKLDAIFTKVTERMIKSVPDVRNWIIPLSGGHDSRLIMNYLFKAGVKNVKGYSYGVRNNHESLLSERVASALGYEWYFIEYTSEIVFELSNEIDSYRKYAFNGTSVPHLQDFIAVCMLKKAGIAQTGDVFVPGHALDFIAGSHLTLGMEVYDSIHSSLIHIIHKHFDGFGYAKRSDNLLARVQSTIAKYSLKANQIPEYFNWQERQTKFIANSVRVYEYVGFEWRIPLWDNELVDYWRNVGFNFRHNRKLYFSVEKDFLFVDVLKNIPFSTDIKPIIPLKVQIASMIPYWIKKILRYAGYHKSEYFDSTGLHLLYASQQETVGDYLENRLIPAEVKKYLSNYPKRMKLCCLPVNSVSTLLIIKNEFSKSVE